METLHTILLGPYKYLLRLLFPRLTASEKEEIQAILAAFNFSGFGTKLGVKMFKHHKSFVGRDFKALAQCALFLFRNYFTHAEREAWLALSKVYIFYAWYVTAYYIFKGI